MNINTINITHFDTPIGSMVACATQQGICLVDYVDRDILEAEFEYLRRHFNADIKTGRNRHLVQVKKELAEYFSGERTSFTVSMHTTGTDFQLRAWDKLQMIPYGETRTYKKQAVVIGNAKAIRAVASANGKNRINILIPCHRVIASNGSLAGYGGGLNRKRWLIELEAENSVA